VIGTEPSARVYELRDLLTRNSVPFGFQHADSEEGSAALQRLGLDPSSGPVVTFHTGVVLADPANTDVAEALGVDIRPAETPLPTSTFATAPRWRAATAMDAWSSSDSGTGTLAIPRQNRPTGLFVLIGAAVHRMAARGDWARPMGLHPHRPRPG
jgi:hypothetical protein